MLERFQDVVTDNPIEQVWKSLRVFLDGGHTEQQIRSIHGIEKGKFEGNVRKQAIQIGYCIRQAEEYFGSSSRVSLATRPVLLYYGAMSLSRALVLLRGTGECSFDALRRNKKHRNHGMELDQGSAANLGRALGPEEFYGSLRCSVFTKRVDPSFASPVPSDTPPMECAQERVPWGHFALFYNSLMPCVIQYAASVHYHGSPTVIEDHKLLKCAEFMPIGTLVDHCPNTLELMKTLPDMFYPLNELGIKSDLCRGSVKVKADLPSAISDVSDQTASGRKDGKVTYRFFVLDISQHNKEHFLAFYKEKNPGIELVDSIAGSLHLRYEVPVPVDSQDSPDVPRYLPDMVDGVNDQKYYILHPETYVHEPAAHLLLLYCLGMMSRYYPDVWMKVIDKDVLTAELTDSLLNVIQRKFPNLILDQMTQVKHSFHL